LDKSEAKSKIVLLITDAENNAGDLGPLTASAAARALGVRVYAVGIGSEGLVQSPIYQNADGSFSFAARQMTFDTRLLEEMALMTDGKFYRVRSSVDLEKIYDEVENLEKTKVVKNAVRRTSELFFWFLNAAFCLLLCEMVLRWWPLRVITV
jgi:Ca-activated chloride channel family protein